VRRASYPVSVRRVATLLHRPVEPARSICSTVPPARGWCRAGSRRVSGISAPVSRLSKFLPAPLGPTMPNRSPRMIRAEKSRATAVRDDCDHESVWRRPRVLDLLKFTENNFDPLVSSNTYSSTE
jgi:hypothetical protein